MDSHSKWKYVIARFSTRKQIPFDADHCSPLTLRHMLLDVRTPSSILDNIARAYCDDGDVLCDLVRCPNLSEPTLAFIALAGPEEIKKFISGTRCMDVVAGDAPDNKAADGGRDIKKLNVMQQINRMTKPQKIKLALSGPKEARGLLIREKNKQISLSVLENPRLTDGEVDFFAKSTSLGEEVLRKIAANPEWSRKYAIAQALVYNAKTPPGISVPLVNRMNDRDLGMLEKNRNVSEAVRKAARGIFTRRKHTMRR